jgi:hypothetical protein
MIKIFLYYLYNNFIKLFYNDKYYLQNYAINEIQIMLNNFEYDIDKIHYNNNNIYIYLIVDINNIILLSNTCGIYNYKFTNVNELYYVFTKNIYNIKIILSFRESNKLESLNLIYKYLDKYINN